MHISHYTTTDILSQGTFSTLYLATHDDTAETVVVRVYAALLSNNLHFQRVFNQVYSKLTHFQHKHLIHTLDTGVADGAYYTVSEYLVDKPLADAELSTAQLVQCCVEVSQVITQLHDRGIVHGGVRASRLFYRAGAVVLGEIDIAHWLVYQSEDILSTELSRAYDIPPEFFIGKKLTHRSDFYHLGLALYELLARRPAFSEYDLESMPAVHAKGTLAQLPETLSHIQPLVDQLLAKMPESRIATSKHFINAVHKYIDRKPNAVAEIAPKHRSGAFKWVALGVISVGLPALYWANFAQTPTPKIPVAANIKHTPQVAQPAVTHAEITQAAIPQAKIVQAEIAQPEATQSKITQAEINPLPAEPDQSISALDKWQQGEDLKTKALAQMEVLQLSSPAGDNAYETYQALQTLFPAEDWAKQGFTSIAEKYLEIARAQFHAGNLEQAIYMTSLGLEVQSEHRSLLYFKAYLAEEKRYKQTAQAATDAKKTAEVAQAHDTQRTRVQALLKQAETQIRGLKLTSPKGDNALESYQALENIDPENPAVADGKTRIAKIYLRLATHALKKNDLKKSQAMLNQGLKVVKAHPALLAFQTTIQQRKVAQQRQARRIQSLFAKAQSQFKQQQWVAPKGNNVHETLKQIQVIAPNHPKVKRGMAKMADQFLAQAKSQQDPKQFARVLSMVNMGISMLPQHKGLKHFKQDLETRMLADRNRQQEQQNLEKRLQQLLDKAQRQMLAGQFFEPKKHNAYRTYSLLTQSTPDHPKVIALRAQLSKQALQVAKQLQTQGQLTLALARVHDILAVSPEHAQSRALRQALKRQIKEVAKIEEHRAAVASSEQEEKHTPKKKVRVFGTF